LLTAVRSITSLMPTQSPPLRELDSKESRLRRMRAVKKNQLPIRSLRPKRRTAPVKKLLRRQKRSQSQVASKKFRAPTTTSPHGGRRKTRTTTSLIQPLRKKRTQSQLRLKLPTKRTRKRIRTRTARRRLRSQTLSAKSEN